MKSQVFLPYDSSSLAQYLAWSKNGISAQLAAMGWAKTADTSQVNWANVVSVPGLAPLLNAFTPPAAWAGGTSTYLGVAGGSAGNPSLVTNAGLTYACILSTSAIALTQALVNTAGTFSGTLTSVAAYNGTNTIYTFSGTPFTANQFQNMQVVISGCSNPLNNGTFFCNSNTTSTLSLANPFGVIGTAQAGSAVISASVTSFLWSNTAAAANLFNGHSLVVTGFVNGANNGTFTVTSSSSQGFAATVAGVNETHGAQAVENTAPASDTVHWVGYNFEIWQTQDASNSTNPIFLRIVYSNSNQNPQGPVLMISVGTGSTGTGYTNGATFTKGGQDIILPSSTSQAGFGVGGANLECDFCVSVSGGSLSMMLWRDAVFAGNSNVPCVLVIDRAHDNFGNDLDAYVVCLTAASSNTNTLEQILYKPGTGGTRVPNSNTPMNNWSIPAFQGVPTVSNNNNAPVLPVFPVGLGYLASPCLGAVAFKANDAIEGSLVPVFMYGQIHMFLIGKGNYSTVDPGHNVGTDCVGIRFE